MEPEKKEEPTEVNKEEQGEEKKVEEQEEKKTEEESKKEDFEKDSEVVSAGKYNQTLRQLREKEAEERDLRKQLEEAKSAAPVAKKPKDEEEDDEDFFEEDGEKKKSKSPDIESLVDAKVKPILERLNQKEANEKKVERDAFFKSHPQYLKDSEKWQELLDEMDNSLNPHSKDSYYQQLTKAHRIISNEPTHVDSDIDKKKRELASESSSKGDGAKKTDEVKSSADERAERLAKNMPMGYEAPKK